MFTMMDKVDWQKLCKGERSNRGCYKTAAVLRPEIWTPYLLINTNPKCSYRTAYTDILGAVNVETSSGRVYKVNKSEQDEATRLNKSRI